MSKFEKGQSGNPAGRPKEVGELRILARERTKDALDTLVSVMNDQASPAAARVSASIAILDRGYGKPSQQLQHTGVEGGVLEIKPLLAIDFARRAAFLFAKAESEMDEQKITPS